LPLERDLDLLSSGDLDLDLLSSGDFDLDLLFAGDLDLDLLFSGDLERDGDFSLDFSRLAGERLLDFDFDFDLLASRLAEALRDLLRLRLLLRLLLRLRERDFGGPGESSIILIVLLKNSVPSNFSIAFFMILYDRNSTTPSPIFSLLALVKVTSPAARK